MEPTASAATTAALTERAAELATLITSAQGELLEILGEMDRRQAFRDEGATSLAAWIVERLGLSDRTARVYTGTAEQLWDFPVLAGAIRSGEVSLDKAQAALVLATTADHEAAADAQVTERARQCTVRQLIDQARATRGRTDAEAMSHHDRRYLRCNDARRTITAQLPDDSYALVRAALAKKAEEFPSDGETPHDQRMCDALVSLCLHSGPVGSPVATKAPVLVVAHADLSLLRGGSGRAELAGLGLLSREAARRLACDADVALAIDDAFGHTMAEGRARRFPSDAQRREVRRRDRHCRFPGCTNALFTNIHHIVHWADGGPTDLSNLVTLCNHHHHTVHEGRWQMSGNANGKLQFIGPTERLMESRPSPLWTRRN